MRHDALLPELRALALAAERAAVAGSRARAGLARMNAARHLTDQRGRSIVAGSRVAYNLSGAVATGTVVRAPTRGNGPIHIKPDREFFIYFYSKKEEPISRVKHWSSLIVIGDLP